MQDVEPITYAAAFASEMEGRGAGSYRAVVAPVTYRLPIDQLAAIAALAEHSGRSRVYCVSNLISIGLEALRGELDKSTQQVIRKLQAKHMQELHAAHGDDEAEE